MVIIFSCFFIALEVLSLILGERVGVLAKYPCLVKIKNLLCIRIRYHCLVRIKISLAHHDKISLTYVLIGELEILLELKKV